jgi:serine/threonine-protein kinase ULK2
MIFGDAPWKGMDEKDLLRNILNKPLNLIKTNVKLTKKAEEILKRTLTIEEKERISWDELL